MNNVMLNYGHVNDDKKLFIKTLKSSDTIVWLKSDKDNVCRIKLIERKNKYTSSEYTIDHFFEAEGLIKGDDVRHCSEISNHIIKRLITPKADWYFLVCGDAFSSDLTREANLHNDVIYFKVNFEVSQLEMIMSVQTSKNNSARMINY